MKDYPPGSEQLSLDSSQEDHFLQKDPLYVNDYRNILGRTVCCIKRGFIMNHHVEKYNSYREEVQKRKKELEAMMSNVDLEQQDILHFLENEKCDAVTMSKITKKLIVVRKRRREIKEEWEYTNWIWQRIYNKMVEKEFVGYKYRTDITKEFKEE